MKILIAAISILLFISNAFAANDIKLGGSLDTYGAGYFQRSGGLYGEARFKPKLTSTMSENSLLYLEGDLRLDTADYSQGVINGLTDRKKERSVVGIKEAYAELDQKWLRLRAGKQIFDWSVTDTVSPADNLNPRDWTDVIRWERMGVPSASLRLGYDNYLEFVYVPLFTPSRLPSAGSRWERDMPQGLKYVEQEVVSRNHGQFGARGIVIWNGFDLGASYFHGYGYSPSVKIASVSAIETVLTPVYYREDVYTASVAKGISGFNIRAEAGYFRQDKRDDFVQHVTGVDKEWNNVFDGTGSLYMLIQYANEIKVQKDNPTKFDIIDFRRGLNNAILGKIKYNFDDKESWALKLEGSYNLGAHDNYIEPALVWKKGNVTAETGVGIISGQPDTFWGGYSRNDRVFTKVAWKF
ncbi:MAG: hypothetical protein EPN22_12830 [Nitrospirae bacterium]|nr:MAG: hypothetical protein EPN22_12830 [Nitrospirota bacterium]